MARSKNAARKRAVLASGRKTRIWNPLRAADADHDSPWLDEERLTELFRWLKVWNVVCCAEADLFGPDVNPGAVDAVLAAMVVAPKHHFLVATAYPEAAQHYADQLAESAGREGHDNPLWLPVDNRLTEALSEGVRYGPGTYTDWIGGLLHYGPLTLDERWWWNDAQVDGYGRVEVGGWWEWTGDPADYPLRWPIPNVSILAEIGGWS